MVSFKTRINNSYNNIRHMLAIDKLFKLKVTSDDFIMMVIVYLLGVIFGLLIK